MYLKKLTLLGFKTFADKTALDFSRGITCIVGPNGGGKSNISDALRFCLGEQSTKALRANRLEEIIFTGSASRKPLGVAEVEMMLNNSDKTLPLEFDEVSILRRIFREGENEFLINKTPCRLKDMQESLMGTGIGTGGLAFLSQNEVDLVLSNPENRRMILEEIAGTNKYKFRKREAVRKLAQTDLNLSRLKDILNEVHNQLKSLESQVRKFKRYNKYKGMLTGLEKDFLTARLKKLMTDYQPAIDRSNLIRETEDELGRQIESLEQIKDEQNKTLWETEEELARFEEGVTNTRLNLQKQNDFKSLLEERISNASTFENQANKEIEELKLAEDSYKIKIGDIENFAKQYRQELEGIEIQLRELLTREQKLREEKDSYSLNLNEKYQAVINETLEIKNKINSSSEKLKYNAQEIAGLESKFNELENGISEYSKTLQKNSVSRARLEECLLENKKILSSLENSYLNEWEKICALNEKEASVNKELGGLTARRDLFKSLEKDLGRYRGGSKAILENRSEFPQVIEALTRLVRFPEHLSGAAETLLRHHLEDIVVETEGAAFECIQHLKNTSGGFITCWPGDSVAEYKIHKKDLYSEALTQAGLSNNENILGWASDLFGCDERYKKIFDMLFADTLIVKDFHSALELRRALKENNIYADIVTAGGDIFAANGTIRGGGASGPLFISWEDEYEKINTALVQAKNALQEIAQNKADLEYGRIKTNELMKFKEKTCESINAKISALATNKNFLLNQKASSESETSRIKTKIEDLATEEGLLASAIKNFEEELIVKEEEHTFISSSFNNQNNMCNRIDQECDGIKKQIQDLLIRRAEISTRESELQGKNEIFSRQSSDSEARRAFLMEQLAAQKEKLEQNRQSLTSVEAELAAMREQMDRVLAEKESLIVKNKSAQDQYKNTLSQVNNIKKQKDELHEEFYKLEVKKAEYETKFTDYKNQLVEYEVIFENISWDAVELPDFTAAEKQITRLKNFVNNFGGVNLAAEDDYNQFKIRAEFLGGQIADLESAKESLLKAVKEYDENCVGKFRETFNNVSEKFERIFTEVFGGGNATLALSNPDDILESGVDIKAQPPGKRLQNIALLSGGERALTSVAFLFALLEVNPTPFVIMDELDAPLDDSNIERVAALIKKYSATSQFIIITHNRKTMEAADLLYGITMEEQGISKVLAVQLEEAKRDFAYEEKVSVN